MFIFYPQLLYLFIIPYFRSFPKRKKEHPILLNYLNYLPFSRQSYFQNQFKKISGYTPLQYRKEKR
ncbi:TPA: AraC family transcriptional regulator [Streptococcus pneumoniae]|uniref:AraC family transcriptional regulator n=1 Tax=Streptococcus pneumoniae TaxID=1313 RepID=UPI00077BED1E|nr:AraC family transcriptional regulator [Streptococcus pneumoniae]MDS3206003.1 AraC family transcriptional regulator [Streptococcus pneumoniae]MDS4690788.1 AraC family transcriptional regulator [Streptococcus pneumoniae]MDS5316943.1 AraC family transcriptional regulator [Streptococcus pneumoniae]MDS8344419.1 AraC family transcriptional regulator [Streptococcus pneumoniae]MDT5504704.1 AraC family transcriptional regulator [Streptococcus pneumoniae]